MCFPENLVINTKMTDNLDQLHSLIYICVLNGHTKYYDHLSLADNSRNF